MKELILQRNDVISSNAELENKVLLLQSGEA